ncbi:MAG: hypothetical protein ACJ74F_19345 [Mycobacterium sp.]|uniref:hypothetical protein n=1 Tax=Mycobacterium sp. TaxID=1785 RepID=UPI003899CB2F
MTGTAYIASTTGAGLVVVATVVVSPLDAMEVCTVSVARAEVARRDSVRAVALCPPLDRASTAVVDVDELVVFTDLGEIELDGALVVNDFFGLV